MVNVSSLAGVASSPGMVHYGAAKAALISLTKNAAIEWGSGGIRVNAVAPGWVKTSLSSFAWQDEALQETFIQGAPINRWGEPGEVAEAICFLASPAATSPARPW